MYIVQGSLFKENKVLPESVQQPLKKKSSPNLADSLNKVTLQEEGLYWLRCLQGIHARPVKPTSFIKAIEGEMMIKQGSLTLILSMRHTLINLL